MHSYFQKIILVILKINLICFIYGQDRIIDYHVHVFSQDLINYLRQQGIFFTFGDKEINDETAAYFHVDRIIANNPGKSVLISAPYAYEQNKEFTAIQLKSLIEKENDFLNKMVQNNKHMFYGFCGINPIWPFALDEVKRCIDILKLDGIKFHFQANQIKINDKKTRQQILSILAYLSIKNTPVLIHLNANDQRNGSEVANDFISLINELNTPLTVILAHGAGAGGFTSFTVTALKEFRKYFNQNPQSNKHIYFDLSGIVLKNEYFGKIESNMLSQLIHEIGYEKFLFGSDYPITFSTAYVALLEKELKLSHIIFKYISSNDIIKK